MTLGQRWVNIFDQLYFSRSAFRDHPIFWGQAFFRLRLKIRLLLNSIAAIVTLDLNETRKRLICNRSRSTNIFWREVVTWRGYHEIKAWLLIWTLFIKFMRKSHMSIPWTRLQVNCFLLNMKIKILFLALIGIGLAEDSGAKGNPGAPPSRPTLRPPSYPGAPPSRPTLRPPSYPGAPPSRPTLRPPSYPGAPPSRPTLRPPSYPGAPPSRPTLRPPSYPGAPPSRPTLRPPSYPGAPPSRPTLRPNKPQGKKRSKYIIKAHIEKTQKRLKRLIFFTSFIFQLS